MSCPLQGEVQRPGHFSLQLILGVRRQRNVLTRSAARARIEQMLSELAFDCEVVILDEATRDYDWGWVFFYQSREFVESGDPMSELLGNAPYIVNKITGEVRITGTAERIEYYVNEYESRIQKKSPGAA